MASHLLHGVDEYVVKWSFTSGGEHLVMESVAGESFITWC